MSLRIEDYALIGDLETAALVGKDGSIDWLCWPRFDSDACFAALVGKPDNGRWKIAPVSDNVTVTRRYYDGTMVLETRFACPDGVVTMTDFMPPRTGGSDLVRLIRCEQGRVAMRTEFIVRFGYGAVVPWVTKQSDGTLRAVAGPDQLVLRTTVPLRGKGSTTVGEFTLAAGEEISFSLTHASSYEPPPCPTDPEAALADTKAFWQEWVARADVRDGGHQHAILRSLVTLRALTYAPTGGTVAAPTTSLPETLGGMRNWDYRYCWLRDATLLILALMNSNYYDEAAAFRDWLVRAVAGNPEQAQIMYGIAGERRLTEWEVGWLAGYEDSRPVRIGNGAHDQLQIDVYGEVMDALYQAHRGGVAISAQGWSVQRSMLEHLQTVWDQPDRGIWESRGAPRHFTFSKVMAWVAFDRGIKMAEEAGLDGPVEQWRATAERIHEEVCSKGWNDELQSFVQSYGSTWLDGSLLLIPTTGFLPPEDPRIASTVRAIEGRLLVDGLVMRHDPAEVETGLAHGEGAFLACSFWLADAWIMLGRHEEARALFERLLTLRNDVGLLSEAYDVEEKRLVGNFPQAFSHIALVNTAHNLDRAEKPAEQRASEQTPGSDRSARPS